MKLSVRSKVLEAERWSPEHGEEGRYLFKWPKERIWLTLKLERPLTHNGMCEREGWSSRAR